MDAIRGDGPGWAHCGLGADHGDPVGCPGVLAAEHAWCLRHLGDEERTFFLGRLGPGSPLDLRGTELDERLLAAVLRRFRDVGGEPQVGSARFERAVFRGDTDFHRTVFAGAADFTGAVFKGEVNFQQVSFTGVSFARAVFKERSSFGRAQFREPRGLTRLANFAEAEFEREVRFRGAVFHAPDQRPVFHHVRFRGGVNLHGVVSHEGLSFTRATFEKTTTLGPLVCRRDVGLEGAHFTGPVVIEAVAAGLLLPWTRFEGPATIAARYARVTLDRALLLHPCTVTTLREPPGATGLAEAEAALAHDHGPDPTVAVTSLRGVDAAMLLLAEVDLTGCAFSGAHHLDQIRLEGQWRLGAAPGGVRWSRGVPRWCAKRQVINEEREWRVVSRARRSSRHDWGPRPADPGAVPGLATLTTTYRQLRKAREDAKDEPGAADFYYGEMEMRRYSHGWRHAERWLLQAYWALSGYGLRASRALGWLAGAMLATSLLMLAFGLPDTPAREYPAGTRVVGKQAPALRAPFPARFNEERALKAADVVVNSVVFRASGQSLTRTGAYVEKAARFTGPVLLGLAVLAVRGRVKRG